METVSKQLVVDKWASRLRIYRLKEFKDDRGMVCETFRIDDEITQDAKMCYISETKPYVMRGPHRHLNQVDNFVTWKDRMLYQFYNDESKETFSFLSDKNSIYLIQVGIGILHSYRNLESTIIKTMNYPTSLFMGEDKKQEIDEIRYEHILEANNNIIVFGAGGRLGKAIVKSLCDKTDYYNCNIIPIFDKVTTDYEVESIFNNLKTVCKNKTVVVNCAGKTNVQSNDSWNVFFESNCQLPELLQFYCFREGWNFIHFSTDYVFQKGDVYTSHYSRSKRLAEESLIIEASGKEEPRTTILRVCNLFSTHPNDTHNIIHKLWSKVKNGETIDYDPRIKFSPTDVKIIADYLSDKLINLDPEIISNDLLVKNMVSDKTYTVVRFLEQFFLHTNINRVEGKLEPWFDEFYSKGKKINIFNSEDSIIEVINNLKGENS